MKNKSLQLPKIIFHNKYHKMKKILKSYKDIVCYTMTNLEHDAINGKNNLLMKIILTSVMIGKIIFFSKTSMFLQKKL